MAQASANNPDVSAKLTEAYLHRLRHEFDESIEKCKEALSLAPNDAGAHILIGDIYTEQGRANDAVLWYQMALDLEPANAAVKSKLARAQSLHRSRKPAAKVSGNPDPDSAYSRIAGLLRGDGFNTLKNIIFVVLLGLFAIAIIAAIANKLAVRTPTRPSSEATETMSLPAERPTPLPSTPRSLVTQPRDLPRSVAVLGPTPIEADFASRLQADPAIARDKIVIRGALADPRGQRMIINFHAGDTSDKGVILQQALTVAYAAIAIDRNIDQLTLRADADFSGGRGSSEMQVAFVGDISRKGIIMHDPEKNSQATLEAIFENRYWNPVYGPSVTQESAVKPKPSLEPAAKPATHSVPSPR